MRPISDTPSPQLRILLCASASHCARVLQAAAQLRVNVHGLQPSTTWPANASADHLVLWALLPATGYVPRDLQALDTEQLWRAQLLQGHVPCAVHMLYGTAAQQAQQLTPWIANAAQAQEDTARAICTECVDAASEHKLFQHLLQTL